MKRILKGLILLLCLALGSAGVWWWLTQESAQNDRQLTLFGHIEIRDALLSFSEQEIIESVLVEEGDRVESGQVLARLQQDRIQALIREAEARVAAQKQALQRLLNGTRPREIERLRAEVEASDIRMENARRSYERIRRSTRQGASTEQALDDARSAFQEAAARLKARQKTLNLAEDGPRQEDINQTRHTLESVQAALDVLRIRQKDFTLLSPASGLVQSRILEPGEMALPGRPVLSLALDDPKWVRAYVPEPQLGHLREGLPASISSDSFPDLSFEGWVGFISPRAEFTPKNVETTELRTRLVYEVRILVNDPRQRLRLGMPVTVALGPLKNAAGRWTGAIQTRKNPASTKKRP